jgi:hypothetical protein
MLFRSASESCTFRIGQVLFRAATESKQCREYQWTAVSFIVKARSIEGYVTAAMLVYQQKNLIIFHWI